MEKVMIKVRGTQDEDTGRGEQIEVASFGETYEENGFTCITYEEVINEEESGVVAVANNLLKINENQVEVVKEGPSATHLVFVPGKSTYSYYETPFGELEVSVHTDRIEKSLTHNGYNVKIYYNLEMNQQFLSRCNVDITVEYLLNEEEEDDI